MSIESISTDKAPLAAGPYSQAIKVNDMIFTAGLIPVDPKTGKIPEEIEDQTKQVMENVMAVLAACGAKNKNIVKTTIYLTDMKTFSTVNGIYSIYLEQPYPVRSCIEAKSLPKGVKIMVDAIAYIGK
ncbi:MAG: Rid family detoxifying hydrolase [Candidatus Methanogranum gryphiswaldense]|nr:MAG: Rid family detoxifying hydrolase [Candidatus Methanogranum sp. U3.2.1]